MRPNLCSVLFYDKAKKSESKEGFSLMLRPRLRPDSGSRQLVYIQLVFSQLSSKVQKLRDIIGAHKRWDNLRIDKWFDTLFGCFEELLDTELLKMIYGEYAKVA